MIREPLMPYDARSTKRRWLGAPNAKRPNDKRTAADASASDESAGESDRDDSDEPFSASDSDSDSRSDVIESSADELAHESKPNA